ncbi:hypothetical protein FQA39_LY17633 [Lamprigera yunnana]|nr:hypothetical protein FQA39_LY17633 [Lamprigera yunnana]
MPDYNPTEKARLLQHNNASNEVLVDVTRYALDGDADKYIKIGYSTYLNLEPVIQIGDSCADFGSGGCQALLNKNSLLLTVEEWKTFMSLESTALDKANDLKSAVERLYEKLGALEFNAYHEEIYGIERYYTVQQCKEPRDKYKIGRKVCRKFPKGKTCSQCLVKRISEIGLRHFLDTIIKYIKDCSNSDTSSSSSSDKEVFKAVEQNGEDSKTTEEKKSEGRSVTTPVS